MKTHLTKFHTFLLFVSLTLLPFAIEAAIPPQFSFEETLPTELTASPSSQISLSSTRYKDGSKSLHWKWTSPAELQYSNATILSRSFRIEKAGIMLWIYNPQAVNDDLHFSFETPSKQVARSFNFHLDFVGWRACWIKYGDMNGEGKKCPIARLTISTPQSLPKGEVWIDRLTFSTQRLNEQITADQQIPTNNCHLQRTPWHWVRLWEWEQYPYALPLTAPTAKELADLEVIESRMDEIIAEQIPAPSHISRTLLPKAEKIYDRAAIRHTKGVWTGAPLLSKDEADPRKGEMRYSELEEMLYTYALDATQNGSKTSEQKFFDVFDWAMDQGFAYGSGQGTNHHYGYTTRRLFRSMWLMRHSIQHHNRTTEYVKTISYWSGLQETRQPYKYGRDELLDTWHTLLMPKMIAAMMQPSEEARLREMRGLSTWLSGSLDFTPGTIGGIKIDGTTFHHGGFYPAYSVGAFASLGRFCRATCSTDFALTRMARQHFKHALMTLATYTSHHDWGLGISGRHPFGKNGHIPTADIEAFGYLALQGNLTDSSHTFDPELAATYLRLEGENGALNREFHQAGITPATPPTGFFVYNYGAVGIHRRGNWVVTLKAFNSDVWCSEIYTRDNRYGRYQSYGTVQICASSENEESTASASGFSQSGWDWNRPPAATTIHLPYDELESPRKGTLMERNPVRFSGVSSFEGRHGVLAFHLIESNKPNFTAGATAYKSVFCFDNRLVFLGSGITNNNTDYPTETTLFQLRLDAPEEIVRLNGEEIEDFPVERVISAHSCTVEDHKGVTYIIKDAPNLHLVKQTQTSPNDKNHRPQTDDFATAYIDHGTSPHDARYEYMALIRPTTEERLEAQRNTPYTVLRHDNEVHALRDHKTQIEAYICYATYHGEGLIREITAETIVMSREDGKALKISVCTPDLGITKKSYTTAQESQPIAKEVSLSGSWSVVSDGVRCEARQEDGLTILRVECQHGQPVEVELVRQ